MAISPEQREWLKKMGPAKVRPYCSRGVCPPTWPGDHDSFAAAAVEWLGEVDEAQRKVDEALQAKGMALAENTLKVAWFAVYAALGAIVVGILAWIFPLK